MLTKIKIWHFILLITVLIIVLRFSHLIDLLNLLIVIVQSLFAKNENVFSQLNFSVIDNIVSLTLIIIIPILILGSRKTKKLLSQQIKFSSTILVLLVIFFLFAPIVTNQHPDFQKKHFSNKTTPAFFFCRLL